MKEINKYYLLKKKKKKINIPKFSSPGQGVLQTSLQAAFQVGR
jgi:hypothetical protein